MLKNWNYTAIFPQDSGYEDIWDQLSKYNSAQYLGSSTERQKELIEEVFNIYRSRNIFPITYYTKEGIQDEIKKCKNKEYPFDGENLVKRPTLGQSLLRFMFPSMQNVSCKGVLNNSPYDRFIDDHKLKRAIEYCFKFKKTVTSPLTPTGLKDGLEMIGGNIATNFLSMRTKMLVDYYMKEGETFYDFSCGFGSRLLGVKSSNKNLKYVGCEPNTQTYKELKRLCEYLPKGIQINNQGSEGEIKVESESIDFSFSSPPYFNLEKYCDEETQCYIKYPLLEDWLEGYVRNTIKNLYRVLKPQKYYAVNIADFKVGEKNIRFVEEWIKISQEEGFQLIKEIPLKLGKSRPTNTSKPNIYIPKVESIYLFQKK